MRLTVVIFVFSIISNLALAEDGYRLWLRYDKVEDADLRSQYQSAIQYIAIDTEGEIMQSVLSELQTGLQSMLDRAIPSTNYTPGVSGIVAGVIGKSALIGSFIADNEQQQVNGEGFILLKRRNALVIAGGDERGVLYGAFRLLKLIQQGMRLDDIYITDQPKIKLRLLNHWDNLDRTVERGYAGFSIWNWHELPEYIDRRYVDYARANASIGINGAVVTNVNANALIFRPDYISKAAALADVFRAYGLQLYLTARFSAPIEQGGLDTADPLDPEVRAWWNSKVAEIYAAIPDFGGFLVKANSEGQPGPQEYGRNHADGANMLAGALAPYGGVVMWRAFVYSDEEPVDRAKQAYNEFVPLDGQFRSNVLVQVKNGPIDFQPREPIHPMFGAMPNTPLMMEFQITKEYLGQGTHLVGLGKMYEEVLMTKTFTPDTGSTVADIISDSKEEGRLSGMAGVSNIGTARNWTGNLFGQADWYAFGRLAWDPYMPSSEIFAEWARLTFGNRSDILHTIVEMLSESHQYCVNYMTPLGLHHIMAAGHHYGPGPWVDEMPRVDWTSVYYHKADETGLGFDRTENGSYALEQYHPSFRAKYSEMASCPKEYLLWFHHVPWDYMLSSGATLWEELCRSYQEGVKGVQNLKQKWLTLKGKIDDERFEQVLMHLNIQEKEAIWWRDACLTYFQTFSGMPFPDDLEIPSKSLEYYKSLNYPYAPGIRPRW